ncbi:hypothetical protein EBI_25692 [Enterocytozoon bieneusi H348]|nr:hypothetical protein EBI_25692 [Enterocytozoon bieneusi H348]|eukprot:XP_002651484.1 hypothetical protein EBI_25692 [Enterocytozoon bieneusi H348]
MKMFFEIKKSNWAFPQKKTNPRSGLFKPLFFFTYPKGLGK